MVLRSRAGTRTLAAREFQTGMLSTACREDEMVVAVRFPAAEPGAGHAFTEFARSATATSAIVAVAAIARANGITIGVGGVAEQPVVRDWPALDGSALDDALNELAWVARCRRRRAGQRALPARAGAGPRQADGAGGRGGAAVKRIGADEPPPRAAHPQRARGARLGGTPACC